MTKIRFNRLLSVVLALAMLATMMSFVFTANAADVSASVYEDLTYTTWPALGIDLNSTNANSSSADARYSDSKVSCWGSAELAVLKVYGSKTFDLSNGFSFDWKMGLGYNDENRGYHCNLYVGDLHFLLMNGSNLKLTVQKKGSTTTYIDAKYIDAAVLDNKGVQAFSISVTADGKLSVAVNSTEIAQTNIDVSALDFSNVSFDLISWFGYSGAGWKEGCIFEDPTLTVNKVPTTEATKSVNVNNWTDLGLVDAVPNALDTTVTQDATTIYGVKGRWGADYAINATKVFDLSGGFTFSWTGNYQWNHVDGYYVAVSIGDLTIAAKCVSGGTNKLSTVYVINNNSDNLVLSPLSGRRGVTGVYGTTLETVEIDSTKRELNFTVTVSGGKLSLTVGDSTGLSVSADDVNVSDIDFSAVTFGLKSIISDSIEWYKFTNPNLTYKKAVKLADNFVVTKDGQGFVKCNGKNWIDRDVDAGTLVTLNAEAAYGYTFQGWVNGVNNTVVSTDPTLTVRANTTNNYTAVFVKNSGKYTVTVLNRFGKVIKTQSVAADETYTLPAAANVTGYTFQGWQVKDSEDTTAYAAGAEYTVTGNVIFVPVYNVEETDERYTINVDGGEVGINHSTTYLAKYDEPVTVIANKYQDKTFSYWTKNGIKVSYNRTYSFYAGPAGDNNVIDLVAVYDQEETAKPVTGILNTFSTTEKVTFLMERSVPAGYSLVESGFILAKSAFGTTDYMSAVNGSTVIKVAASNTSANGQYMLNVKTNASGVQVYAVSYVTYVDASGKLHTVYSTAASATAK